MALAVRHVKHKYGPYTPILFLTLGPLITAASTALIDMPLTDWLHLGGHHWSVPSAMLALSLLILLIHPNYLANRLKDFRAGRSPVHSDKPV